MIEFLKHDCMWSGNCDRKCQGKMESFLSKSPFSNDNLSEIYFNLCGGQMFTNGHDSIDLLDSLDAEDFNINDLMNGFSSNQNHQLNNCQQQASNNQFNSYYQCQQPQTTFLNSCQLNQQSVKSSTNFNTISLVNINQIQQQQSQSNQTAPTATQQPTNQTTVINKFDSSSLLNSSLNNNDLLLNSNSANIILTQHNQQVDNSQLPNHNSNQINYNQTSLNTNLNNLNNQDLVNCTNETASIGNSIHSATSNLNSLNTQTNQHTSFSNYQNMINYGFDSNFSDSTFCSPCHVTDSAGSSTNSECSSSVLLERTDYDTDDIEDDLDLLEDIIEEECDPSINLFSQRSNCHSIANSLESCSDVEMIASPISDSLINDHSYGASSIEVLTNQPISNPLATNTIITNVQTSSYANQQNSTTTRTLINHHRNHQTELTSSKLTNKRKSLSNLNNTSSHQSNSKKNLQRHSGTSLLMKEKQSKIKKVMDTDRRKEHNESERQRRDVLKNAFLSLRNKCPKLSNSTKKSSRIQILNEATNYIKSQNESKRTRDLHHQQELKRNNELKLKLTKIAAEARHLIGEDEYNTLMKLCK